MKFSIDLTGYDLSQYEQNPAVLWQFDYVQPPIGRAIIADDKKSVEVELNPRAATLFAMTITPEDFELAESYTNEMDTDEVVPTLNGLSLVPKNQRRHL